MRTQASAYLRSQEPMFTCREVASTYNVHIETVRRWVRKGAVKVVLVGPHRLVRIRQSEAEKHFVDPEEGTHRTTTRNI